MVSREIAGKCLEVSIPGSRKYGLSGKHPDTVIICDEVGSGIVPLDSFEREYRERLGRLLCEIAAKAERVERIVCGIGQRIK